MDQAIKQYDIQDHQLPPISRPSVVRLTYIGEAKVTKTIFGKAKVRINHEQDKKRRVLLLATLALAAAVAVAAVREGLSALRQPERNPPHATAPSSSGEQGMRPQSESGTLVIRQGVISLGVNSQGANSQGRTTMEALGLKTTEQMASKPGADEPLAAGKPKKAKSVKIDKSSDVQPDVRQPSLQSEPTQPATPAITQSPTKPPELDVPATVAPSDGSLNGERSSTGLPPGRNQLQESFNLQP